MLLSTDALSRMSPPAFTGCQCQISAIPGAVLPAPFSSRGSLQRATKASPRHAEERKNLGKRSSCFFFIFYIFSHLSDAFAACLSVYNASSTFSVLGAVRTYIYLRNNLDFVFLWNRRCGKRMWLFVTVCSSVEFEYSFMVIVMREVLIFGARSSCR